MVNLIYENGKFRFEEGSHLGPLPTIDVFMTVRDVVPASKQREITQNACLFISRQLNTEYSTEGIGDMINTEVKTIDSISEINFRLSQK